MVRTPESDLRTDYALLGESSVFQAWTIDPVKRRSQQESFNTPLG
jgi:hypothetical protein